MPLPLLGAIGGGLFGTLAGKLFEKDAPQFTPTTAGTDEAIGLFRKGAEAEITDPRKSTQVLLDRLGESRRGAVGDISATGQSRFAAMQDLLAGGGGLDAGARERLARGTGRDIGGQTQEALSQFAGLESGVRGQDFAAQEALKEKRFDQLAGGLMGRDAIANRAAAANLQAQGLTDTSNRALTGSLGLAGLGLGAKHGGGLFSSIGNLFSDGGGARGGAAAPLNPLTPQKRPFLSSGF